MNDSMGPSEGRHAGGEAYVLVLASFRSSLKIVQESYHSLTTNDGNVDLDTCPDKDVGEVDQKYVNICSPSN